MTKKEAQQVAGTASVTARGAHWGEVPVWTLALPGGDTVDVHANDEEEARTKAVDALVEFDA